MSTSGDALPHVSDGVLPPHVEQQRTRVSVDPDAPRYTNTVEYAGAYFANGVDNSFSIERFKRDFRIEVQSMNEEEIVFDLIGIDAALANAFRRILISDVPTMAIDRVFVLNNTSMLEDEVLAHRLGLIPIRADPRFFTELTAEDDADEHNVIAFRLQVQCYRQSPGEPAPEGAAPGTSSAEDGGVIHNARVLSGQLQWIPQGEQEERFRDAPIASVNDDILIAKLRPGQEIELEVWCFKGQGKTHAKWSPVATASYRLLPEISVVGGAAAAEAADAAAAAARPAGGFDAEERGAKSGTASRPRPCSMKRECVRVPGWDGAVKLSRVRDHFIFSIETTGAMPPEQLFQEAVKLLMRKVADLGVLLKDATAGQANMSSAA